MEKGGPRHQTKHHGLDKGRQFSFSKVVTWSNTECYPRRRRPRVADVKIENNFIRRPITKLAPLPIKNDFNEEIEPSKPTRAEGREDNKTHRSKRPNLTHALLSTLFVICFMLPLCLATTMETHNLPQNSIGPASTITLLLTCFTLHCTTSYRINFTSFQGELGIYFERIGIVNIISSSWNLVNYVNLKLFGRKQNLHSTIRKLQYF